MTSTRDFYLAKHSMTLLLPACLFFIGAEFVKLRNEEE
jgi:hypothetical protein